MDSYRVFVSYSHEDAALAEKIVNVLKANNLTALWDKELMGGRGFADQIKTFIAHSHVFLPVITQGSSARGWVQQEIGYAMGLRVPVLPVRQGLLPGEMLQTLQAISVANDASDLASKLARPVFEDLILNAEREARPLYECAMQPEERANMLAEYADRVREIRVGDQRAHGRVRQKGALGTFAIPNKHVHHPIWQIREGRVPRGQHRRECLLRERKALEKHAQGEGCRLIINPWLDYDGQHGHGAARARFQTVLEFLQSPTLPPDKVEVAFLDKHPPHSLTLIGDWFMAESVSGAMGVGYRQTIFTRHAPSIRSRLDAFDQEFEELLQESNTHKHESREAAIRRLQEMLAGLNKKSDNDAQSS